MSHLTVTSGVSGYFHGTLGKGRSAITRRFRVAKGKNGGFVISGLSDTASESNIRRKWHKAATYNQPDTPSDLVYTNSLSAIIWKVWITNPRVDWELVSLKVPTIKQLNTIKSPKKRKKKAAKKAVTE